MLSVVMLAFFGWLQNQFATNKTWLWAFAFGVINIALFATGSMPLPGMIITFTIVTA